MSCRRCIARSRACGASGRCNLVIVLEESLGAGFVERLGGRPIAPHLSALADEGIWFDQLYATGTRSVRGIEAVIAGFPPTPARSVVKLSKSQQDFSTLASLLRDKGYHNEFIYGGESHFDNMRGFFLGNGFQQIVDQKDYPAPKFVGSWGVSDEDLFDKTHERLEALHAAGEPFFMLMFSSSNHSPFEFPDGRIERVDQEKQTVDNAVRYADFALGQFIERARQSDYWENTLFLVVADHDTRVYGDALVPIDKFHIPGVIRGCGHDAAAGRFTRESDRPRADAALAHGRRQRTSLAGTRSDDARCPSSATHRPLSRRER